MEPSHFGFVYAAARARVRLRETDDRGRLRPTGYRAGNNDPATAFVGPAAALAVVVLVRAAADWRTELGHSVLWPAVALAVTAVVWVTQKKVLGRAQPLAAADVTAADNAIRSRSLHALAGSGTTLVLYCAVGQVIQLTDAYPSLAPAVAVGGTIAAVIVPWFGWWLAISPWPVTRITDEAAASPLPAPAP